MGSPARLTACVGILLGLLVAGAAAQTPPEAAAARRLESLRDRPGALYAFLRSMPKGGDLHNHLSGAVYAESYLRWALEDGLCLQEYVLMRPPCAPAPGGTHPALTDALASDPNLGNRLIDAWSTRNWTHSGRSGHDQFFVTFGRFAEVAGRRAADSLAEVSTRAAQENVSYLELLVTPDGGASRQLGRRLGWQDDLDALHAALLAYRPGPQDTPRSLDQELHNASERLDQMEAAARGQLRCDRPDADPGCAVGVRYLFQIARASAPEQVFAQMVAAFELARRDPRVVGLNLVQPEDSALALRDFDLHMRMLAYLRGIYPQARLSLHAGELAPGLVPPEALRSHIRDSLLVAGAERIGHGVDIWQEDDPEGLFRLLAQRGVLLEACLSSNDLILGVSGKHHPLRGYLSRGVPVALATDDAGVARSEHTREFQRAVEEQGLDYRQLKTLARNSLEYAFLEGASLWEDAANWRSVLVCQNAEPDGVPPPSCLAFLQGSARALAQWDLEARFAGFEAALH